VLAQICERFLFIPFKKNSVKRIIHIWHGGIIPFRICVVNTFRSFLTQLFQISANTSPICVVS
jgi:hypothetical protein